jgi:hypothetical protein
MSTLKLYGSNSVLSFGLKVNSTKPIVYLAIGVVIGVLAINYIDDKNRYY